MTYAYLRVSTKEQHLDRQYNAVKASFPDIPEDNIYADKMSGKEFNRPMYLQMKCRLHEGDLLVLKSIDRLGRNYEEILQEWKEITKVKKADITVLDFPLLDTRKSVSGISNSLTDTLIADIVLQLLSYLAQSEREFNAQRTREGLSAAKAKGVQLGRRCNEYDVDKFNELKAQVDSGEITKMRAASELGVSYATWYNIVKRSEAI